MKLLLISDGRPGHANLSEGIVAALARNRSVAIERMDVSRGRWPGPVAALSTRSILSDERILSMIYGIEPATLPAADVVVSAGSETLAANVCAARLLGAQNVFYGSLRQYRASDFTLVLTSYAQSVKAPNIIQAMKPSALDPDTIPIVQLGQTQRRLGLLIGGPTNGISFSPRDWQQLVRLVTEVRDEFGVDWIVSNSRRTPDEATSLFRNQVTTSDAIQKFIDVEDPNRPPLSDLFGDVDGVICTADSSSMISEGIWARRPMLALSPHTFKLTRKERQYRIWLEQNGWYAHAKLADTSARTLLDVLAQLRPLTNNPLDQFAALLAQHLKLPKPL